MCTRRGREMKKISGEKSFAGLNEDIRKQMYREEKQKWYGQLVILTVFFLICFIGSGDYKSLNTLTSVFVYLFYGAGFSQGVSKLYQIKRERKKDEEDQW